MKRSSLNHAYRLVWSERCQAFVAVAEHVAGRGKRSAGAVLLGALAGLAQAAAVLPTGGQIVAGQGNIAQSGATMTVTQNTQRMIANWQSFNVGQNATVNFLQPNASATVLNRVLSADPSLILGNINANGRVYLINPGGVIFGQTARVNVGGLMASSFMLNDADFLAGRTALAAQPGAGAVENLGQLAAREGGFVSLVGATVNNAGHIAAPGGQVALVAGQKVRLDITDSGLLGVEVDGGLADAQVVNSGHIAADGGRVWMTARQAGPLLGTAINQSGSIRANAVAERDGEIWLDAGPGATAQVGGTIEARGDDAGERGGRVVATGGTVVQSGAIDVSGAAGGGRAYIGGGWQGKDPAIANADGVLQLAGARIVADATASGDGGQVVLWSEQATRMSGLVSVRGSASGQGGQVETSSHGSLGLNGQVLLAGGLGGGFWLLDPNNITISSAANSNVDASFTATADPANVQASAIESAINVGGATVTVTTDGNININADIAKTTGSASTLVFKAGGDIQLGAAGVSKKISAINDGATPTVTSSLNVDFQGSGGAVATSTGNIAIYGEISTNGGTVNFYKPTLLANAKPVSTRVLAPNPGDPAATPDSGKVTFWQAVTLGGTNSVTIDTQSVQDGQQTYLRRGGDIEFKDLIQTADANAPRALILNTTGAVSIDPAYGGDAGSLGNYSGAVTFGGNVGTLAAPLDSLTVIGPSYTYLNGDQINLKKQSGDTLVFSAPGSYRPHLVLGQASTAINVTGFAAGIADYTQKTFDIVAGNNLGANATLDINADHSIQIVNSMISGEQADSDISALTVNLNASRKAGANSGAILLQGSQIYSYGADINLGSASQRAYGVATEQNTDGIRVQSSTLDSAGGDIKLYGGAPLATTAGGAAIDLYGSSSLLAGSGDIIIDGKVGSASGGASKDGVLIGNKGQATVAIETTSGKISILGDASAVGLAATAGASYDGVVISDAAMIRSQSGDIEITGKGGGGNNNNIGENYGVVLKNTDTQVVSQSGNIVVTGVSGGKTTSYGIYASGDDIALGQERDTTTAKAVVGARPFSGNIDLVADTIKLTNSSSSHLRVTGPDQLNIRPYHDVAIQIGGTESDPPSSSDPDNPTTPLYLGSSWFSGSNAVFTAGFGEINIGGYGSTGVGSGVAPGASTTTLTVAGLTTVRDDLNLMMTGSGGKVAIDQPLAVVGAGNAARVLDIEVDAGIAGSSSTSLINVDRLRLTGGGDFVLGGPNLVNTLAAASSDGSIEFANAQALNIGTVARSRQGSTDQTVGVTAAAAGGNVTLGTSSGNLLLKDDVTAAAVASLWASAGAVTEADADTATTGTPIVSASQLAITARDTSSLANINQADILAVSGTGSTSQEVIYRNANGVTVAAVTDGAGTTVDGVDLAGKLFLTADSGAIGQTAKVVAGALAVRAPGAIDLSLAGPVNAIGTLAADSATGEIKVRNNAALTVGSVSASDSHATSLAGVTTADQDITLATAQGNLTLANDVAAGSGVARLAASAGAVNETGSAIVTASQLAVIAQGNSSLSNANAVDQLAAHITGAGQGISFGAAGPIKITEVVGNNGLDAAGTGSSPLVATVTGLTAGGTAVLSAASGDITQDQDVAAGSLRLDVPLGAVDLSRTSNDIGTLAAQLDTSGKSITVATKGALTVGSVAGLDGIATNDGAVGLTASADAASTSGDLTVSQAIDAGNGDVALTSVLGGVNESGAGKVLANGLAVRAVASSLLNGANDVATLAAAVTGSNQNFAFDDINDLAIGTVGSLDGITTAGGSIDVASIGQLTGNQPLASNNGAITLSAGDGSNASDLLINHALAAGSGAVTLTATRDIVLGPVVANGSSTSGGSLSATAAGDLTVNHAVTVSGPLALTASGTASGRVGDLTTNAALSSTSGGVTLDAAHDLAVNDGLAAGSGAIVLLANNDIDLGPSVANGSTTSGASLTASAGGNLTVNHAATTSGGQIKLTASGIAGGSPVGDLTTNAALTSNGGAITLDAEGNLAVNHTLAAGSGAIVLTAGNDLDLGPAVANGSTTSGASLQGTAGGDLQVRHAVTTSGGAITLTATAGDLSTSGALSSNGGAVGLTAGNDLTVDESVSAGNGAIVLEATRDIVLGPVGSTSGLSLQGTAGRNLAVDHAVNTAGGAITLTATAGDLTTSGALVSNDGAIALLAGNDLLADAAISSGAGDILLDATRDIVLGPVGNTVSAGGNIQATAGRDLAVDHGVASGGGFIRLTATAALDTSAAINSAGGEIVLESTNDLTLGGALSAGSGNIRLASASGAVAASGAGAAVSGSGLAVVAATGARLDNALNNVVTLAANISGGDLVYRDLSGFELGSVTTVEPSSRTVSGIAASGQVDLTAGLGIEQTAGNLRAAALRVTAGDDVNLTSGSNHVPLIAATVTGTGGFAYTDTGSVVIGDVATAAGSTSGIATAGKLFVRTGQNLETAAAVSSQAAGNQALVLSATAAYTNRAGATAVSAPNGRWLIYDDNPALVDRLDGLQWDFRRLHTYYQTYLPGSVTETGNGYITTANPLDPNTFFHLSGGATTDSGAFGNRSVSVAIASDRSAMAGRADVLAMAGESRLAELGLARSVAFAPEGGRTVELDVPLIIIVNNLRPFTSSLADFVRGQQVVSATLGDGSPLPAWLQVDAGNALVRGRFPESQLENLKLRLGVRSTDGRLGEVQVVIAPTALSDEEADDL